MLGAMHTMYNKFITKCKSISACPLCERKFPSEDEIKLFIENMEKTIQSAPGKIEAKRQMMQELVDRKAHIMAHRALWDALDRVDQEIPSLTKTVDDLESEKQQVGALVNEVRRKLIWVESSRCE